MVEIGVTSGKSKPKVESLYKLHGYIPEVLNVSKYLGITLTNLFLYIHKDNVAAKGNKTLGFIRPSVRDCRKFLRETSFQTIVRPTLEYVSTLWDPTSQKKIKAFENMQRQAAHFIHRMAEPGRLKKKQPSLHDSTQCGRHQQRKFAINTQY